MSLEAPESLEMLPTKSFDRIQDQTKQFLSQITADSYNKITEKIESKFKQFYKNDFLARKNIVNPKKIIIE